ncbi:MAG: NUDIX domain-containing protein [Anaerolineales bacterium]|nr:NUDIX domain-containing protein [Anaerolineales bacterium]MCK6540035.1 NUDIX domain-containing protein [Anaerolineales bacterium]
MSDEQLDVVNDKDEVIGQASRSDVHRRGLQHRGVHVFLFDAQGEMLIQKRSADRASSPSLLDCSVSEHVKAGESYREAAMRGLKEEMGVEGIEINLLGKIQMEYGPNDNEISVIYEGKIQPGQVRFDPEEISEVRFMRLDEIRAGIDNAKETYCAWFVEIMNWYSGKPAKLKTLQGE